LNKNRIEFVFIQGKSEDSYEVTDCPGLIVEGGTQKDEGPNSLTGRKRKVGLLDEAGKEGPKESQLAEVNIC
jgi:hypothetical protein